MEELRHFLALNPKVLGVYTLEIKGLLGVYSTLGLGFTKGLGGIRWLHMPMLVGCLYLEHFA